METERLKVLLARIVFNIEQLADENEVDDFPDVERFVKKTGLLIAEAVAIVEAG